MKRSFWHCLILLPVALSAASCGRRPIMSELVPLPGMEDEVPVITEKKTVVMQTTAGEVVIEVYPEAAPNAAQRFLELVETGYYDAIPISRVVDNFVGWRDRAFDDDPPYFAHERGTLAFAKAGKNTASTQVFINLRENNRLVFDYPDSAFTVFGAVVEGMDVVDRFAKVGDMDQPRLWRAGMAYVDETEPRPTMIESAIVR